MHAASQHRCLICLHDCGDDEGVPACSDCKAVYHKDCLDQLEAGCPICDRPSQKRATAAAASPSPPQPRIPTAATPLREEESPSRRARTPPLRWWQEGPISLLHLYVAVSLLLGAYLVSGAAFGVALWAIHGPPPILALGDDRAFGIPFANVFLLQRSDVPSDEEWKAAMSCLTANQGRAVLNFRNASSLDAYADLSEVRSASDTIRMHLLLRTPEMASRNGAALASVGMLPMYSWDVFSFRFGIQVVCGLALGLILAVAGTAAVMVR